MSVPPCLRVAMPPDPTPTPFVSDFTPDSSIFVEPPPPASITLPPQSGVAAALICGRTVELRVQEPISLRFTNGGSTKGVLDAVSEEHLQIVSGGERRTYRLAEVAETAQF